MGAGRSIGRSFGKMFVLGAGVIAAAGIGKLLSGSIDEAREAQKVGAATEAIIKATGGAARITAEDVGAMAGRLSAVTGIDDEAIQSGENLLLTFKNIRNEVDGKFTGTFDRATAATLDLSAAGFGSIESASKTMGKALNDPVKGVTALSRAGVTFTDQQKKQIATMVESGNVLGAQNLILKEVEGQVGGVAEAAATSGEKAKVAFGNLKEQIGTALLPVIDKLATVFSDRIAPAISGFITNLQSGQGSAGAFAGFVRGTVVPAVMQFAGFIRSDVVPAVQRFAGFVRDDVVPAVMQFAGFIRSDVVPAVQRFAGFVRDDVVPVLQQFGNFLIQKVVPAVRDALGSALDSAKSAFNTVRDAVQKNRPQLEQLANAFKKVGAFILTKLVPAMITLQAKWLPVLGAAIRAIVTAAAFWVNAFNKVKSVTITLGNVVAGAVKFFQTLKDGATRVMDNLVAVVRRLPGKIQGVFAGAVTFLPAAGRALIQGLINGIEQKIGEAVQKVKDGLNKIRDMLPGSPIKEGPLKPWNDGSPGKLLMGLLAKGIADSADKVGQAAETVVKKVKEKLANLRDTIASVKSDFASLVEPIASAFTGDLFEATTAKDFVASLMGTKGQLQGLIAAFKTLIGQGLNPKFLYQLFQSGNAGLILDLAKNPALAAEAGALFNDVTDLSSQLGGAVAGATKEGQKLEAQTVRLEKKLDHLIATTKKVGEDVGRAVNDAASNGKRRAA